MSESETVAIPPAANPARAASVDITIATMDSGEKGGQEGKSEIDPNAVDFDGPNDSECAVNWSPRKKWSLIACLSFMTFVTYVQKSIDKSHSLTLSE